MPTVAKAGAVVETMTAVAAAKEAACARVESVYTRRDRPRASTGILASSSPTGSIDQSQNPRDRCDAKDRSAIDRGES